MTELLTEQMRSLVSRLNEITQATIPDTGLEGSFNPKQLAELLGVSDLQTFVRSMNKIRAGDADKLTRMEITELAEAFVRLLAAEEEDTQKAMIALKRVSAREEPVMEDDSVSPKTMPFSASRIASTWQLISNDASFLKPATVELRTTQLPSSSEYESALFFPNRDSEVVSTYNSKSDALKGHIQLARQYGLNKRTK